jgi:O-antigen/teichoic acid export membrane protein
MKELLLKGSAFRILESIISIATVFLLTPYFIDVLGSSNYGLWILILSILGWFNVVELGFPQAIQRQIVQAIELKDNQRVNTVFSTGIVLFGILGLISVAILVGLTQVPAIFGVTDADQITLTHILLVLSVKILWGFLMNPFHGFFSGLLRFDIDANLSSLNEVGKSLLVFWLIADLNIWGAVVATLAADIVTNTLKIFYAKRLFPSLKFKPSLVTIEEIKILFSYSKHLVLNGVINTISNKSGPLIITQLFDLQSLAIQKIAGNLVAHVQGLVGTITGVFGPVYNKMVARKQNMERIFIQTTTIYLFISTVLNVCLLMFGKAFIVLWVGTEFEYAYYILYFIVFSSIFSGFSTTANRILLAQANHKLISLLSFGILIIGMPTSIYLALQFGLIGFSIGGAITSFIFNVFIRIALLKRYNDYKTSGIYKGLTLSIFITFSLSYLGNYFLALYNVDTWSGLILVGTITFPFIVLICWTVLLNKELKQILFNAFKGFFTFKKVKT